LGVQVRPATEKDRRAPDARSGGLVIERIANNSPMAGQVPPGFIILQAAGRPVNTAAELENAAEAAKNGTGVLLLQVEDPLGRTVFVPVRMRED
jgi:S1-C subfamily serine protease